MDTAGGERRRETLSGDAAAKLSSDFAEKPSSDAVFALVDGACLAMDVDVAASFCASSSPTGCPAAEGQRPVDEVHRPAWRSCESGGCEYVLFQSAYDGSLLCVRVGDGRTCCGDPRTAHLPRTKKARNGGLKYVLFQAAGDGCVGCVRYLVESGLVDPWVESDTHKYNALEFAEWSGARGCEAGARGCEAVASYLRSLQ